MIESFESIWQRALTHHAEAEIKDVLATYYSHLATPEQLAQRSDADYLSLISRRVFRAGMKHSVIDAKWPAFEEAFWGFKPEACVLIDDARFEELMQNTAIIRHWGKLKTVPINAQMVLDVAREYGSFGQFLAQWPTEDIVGLWGFLKKQGAHLGGDGASRFLRMAGKDTFVLTDDVVRALVNAGVVSKKPTSLKDLKATQLAFNEWHQQSGRPLAHISMILAFSIGRS